MSDFWTPIFGVRPTERQEQALPRRNFCASIVGLAIPTPKVSPAQAPVAVTHLKSRDSARVYRYVGK